MDFDSIRETLLRIVVWCLEEDTTLVPISSLAPVDSESDERDPDDFRFWSEEQARRIAVCIHHAFDVEYTTEVVLADANVSSLAKKILVSRELLSPPS
jgi:phosphatidylethanolamine N-methyltransferase